MKVFISSVRKGLEEERDALPGLIKALGHTPVRFENLSAQPTPSREACLAALESADVCLFLLGPKYGHVFPETGQSATHDEWVHAQRLGKPRLVYRKSGVTFEPDQHQFTRTVEAYGTGVFRASFSDTADLQVKVVQGLRELESRPSPLDFIRLAQQPSLNWIADDKGSNSSDSYQGPLLEVHVLPIDHPGLTSREMEQMSESLRGRVRRTGYVSDGVELILSKAKDHAAVGIKSDQSRTGDKPQAGELREVWLFDSGQISTRATLPRDGLGSILDHRVLPKQVADMLRLTGALNIIQQGRVALAVGVPSSLLLNVGTFDPHRSRTTAQLLNAGRPLGMLRTEPDESVSLAALWTGADEVAGILVRAFFALLPT